VPTFEDLYEAFRLEPAQREGLQKLAGLGSLGKQQSARLLVETVVINEGERTIVSSEETHTQLVRTH